MLLVNTIRDNFENTLAGLQKRNFPNAQDVLIQVLDLDNKRKETQSQRDSLQSESNNYSKEIGILMRGFSLTLDIKRQSASPLYI